jgi:hypothetical protein
VRVLFFCLPFCGGVDEAGEEAGDDFGFEFGDLARRRGTRRGGGRRRKDKVTYVLHTLIWQVGNIRRQLCFVIP